MLIAEGEFALVRQHLEEAFKAKHWMVGDHDLYATLIDAAAQQRDLEALQVYTALAEETAMNYQHRLYMGVAQRAWGVAHRLTGDYAESETRLNRALALFEELGARWQIGRTLRELGELALAQGDAAGARDYLSRALAHFEALGAVPDAQRTRQAMASLEQ